MTKKAIALIKSADRPPGLVVTDRPEAGPGEAILRVATVGLCRTDILVAYGTVPITRTIVLGHEFSGWVEDVGPASDAPSWVRPGALAAVDPTAPGRDGMDAYMGLDHDGCLATFAKVRLERLHDASGMDPKVAAYLEPVACALGGAEVAAGIGGHGLIVGDNRITQLTAKAVETMSAGHRVSHEVMSAAKLRSAIADRSAANKFDWIIETKATEEIFADAGAALKAGGSLIAKSRHAESLAIPLRDYVLRRISLLGRTRSDFGAAMTWLRGQQAFVEDLIGREFPLSEWRTAFAHARGTEDGKTFVSPAME